MSKQKIEEQLKKVEDPELDLDIWTLNLVREVEIDEDDKVDITMTLTSPMCPYGPEMMDDIKEKLSEIDYKDVNITITFHPPWEPPEELRDALGI